MNKKSGNVEIWIVLAIVVLFGWMAYSIFTSNQKIKNKTFEQDECQYMEMTTYYGYSIYTHKGSCTNCWARMENLIKQYQPLEKQ